MPLDMPPLCLGAGCGESCAGAGCTESGRTESSRTADWLGDWGCACGPGVAGACCARQSAGNERAAIRRPENTLYASNDGSPPPFEVYRKGWTPCRRHRFTVGGSPVGYRIFMETAVRRAYTCTQGGVYPERLPPGFEVRLPQGLRFADVRRSTIGVHPMARCCPRAAKSSGRLGLYSPASFLYSLRLPSAASIPCANLRCLLDGNSCPDREPVCALR